MTERAIRSVCVVGSGVVGLSAAAAFARVLAQIEVEIVSAPSDPAALADESCATLPSIHRFHATIGIDELSLVRDGAATHLLGTHFENWPAGAEPWTHAFGEYGLKAGDLPFHAIWHAAHLAGRAAPFGQYSAAVMLAEAGKFTHPSRDPASPLGGFLYALRLDRAAYANRLSQNTAALPRRTFVAAERDSTGIAAVRLSDGSTIQADLYLDCTGPQALLRSLLDQEFEPWDAWLPCDRIRFEDSIDSAISALDRVDTQADGWRRVSPMPYLSRVTHAWGSRFAEGREEAGAIAIKPGRRPRPWAGNVLALGDAAAATDPLFGTPLHLAHAGILLALELLPGRDFNPIELAEYNRRFAEEAEGLRDFLALHYRQSGRSDPFWAEAAKQPPPPGLARTLEQFRRRGRLPPADAQGFDADSWIAALLGLGVLPQHADPVAQGVDPDKAAAAMEALARRLADAPATVPAYREILARMGTRVPGPQT